MFIELTTMVKKNMLQNLRLTQLQHKMIFLPLFDTICVYRSRYKVTAIQKVRDRSHDFFLKNDDLHKFSVLRGYVNCTASTWTKKKSYCMSDALQLVSLHALGHSKCDANFTSFGSVRSIHYLTFFTH